MAESEDLVIRLRADMSDLSAKLAEANQKVGTFSTSTVAKGVVMGTMFVELAKKSFQFGVDAVKAYASQEQAITRLSRAVGTDAANALTRYANELQKTTTFSDDSVLALETQLANFGLLPGSIKSATGAIVNYAAATGKSLPEAGAEFSQALSGQSRELKKYGLVLGESHDRTQNLEKVTGFLQERFEGAAGLMKNTVSGSVENLKNRFGDLQKGIGQELIPVVKTVLELVESLANSMGQTKTIVGDWLKEITGASKNELTMRQLTIDKLTAERKVLMDRMEILKKTYQLDAGNSRDLGTQIEMLTRRINVTKEQQKQEVITTAVIKKETKLQTCIIGDQINEETRQYREMAQNTKAARGDAEKYAREQTKTTTAIVSNEYREQLKAGRESFEANASFSQALLVKLISDAKSWGSVLADTAISFKSKFSGAMADLIVDGGKFKDAMKNIGQAILKEFITQVIEKMVAAWMAAMLTMRNAAAATAATGAATGAAGAGVGAATGGAGAAAGAGAGAGVAIAGAGAGLALYEAQRKMLVNQGFGKTEAKLLSVVPGVGLSVAAINKVFGGGRRHTDTKGSDAWMLNMSPEEIAVKLGTSAAYVPSYDSNVAGSAEANLNAAVGRLSPAQLVVRYSSGNPGTRTAADRQYKKIYDAAVASVGGPISAEQMASFMNNSTAGAGAIRAFATGGVIDEPTMLTGLRSGKQGIMGEAGPEAIVPMNGGGGGDIHIHINGAFIEGDPGFWQRLIRERIAPEIRRWTMSSPVGPFQRYRGTAS